MGDGKGASLTSEQKQALREAEEVVEAALGKASEIVARTDFSGLPDDFAFGCNHCDCQSFQFGPHSVCSRPTCRHPFSAHRVPE